MCSHVCHAEHKAFLQSWQSHFAIATPAWHANSWQLRWINDQRSAGFSQRSVVAPRPFASDPALVRRAHPRTSSENASARPESSRGGDWGTDTSVGLHLPQDTGVRDRGLRQEVGECLQLFCEEAAGKRGMAAAPGTDALVWLIHRDRQSAVDLQHVFLFSVCFFLWPVQSVFFVVIGNYFDRLFLWILVDHLL